MLLRPSLNGIKTAICYANSTHACTALTGKAIACLQLHAVILRLSESASQAICQQGKHVDLALLGVDPSRSCCTDECKQHYCPTAVCLSLLDSPSLSAFLLPLAFGARLGRPLTGSFACSLLLAPSSTAASCKNRHCVTPSVF